MQRRKLFKKKLWFLQWSENCSTFEKEEGGIGEK